MGKAARIKRMRRLKNIEMEASFSERLTKNFQKELRSSELWDQMVAEVGEEKAEQLLKNCHAQVKSGEDR